MGQTEKSSKQMERKHKAKGGLEKESEAEGKRGEVEVSGQGKK